MQFKRYLILGLDYTTKYAAYPNLRIKVKHGITSEEVKKELSRDWIPDPKDRLYFFAGCSVPRFKVREKYKTTIKPEYATVAFMSATDLKGTDDMFEVINNAVSIDGNYILDWLQGIYGKKHHFVIKYKSILLNCEDDIIINFDHWYKMLNYCPDDALYPNSLRKWRMAKHHEEWALSSLEIQTGINFYSPVINSKLNDLNCTIYSQDAILKYLNEDSVVIDEKRYTELRLMANSSDKENIILVMELMANANFKESFVYLLLLLKEFNSKITERKKEINHVNFKALLHFFNLDSNKIKNIDIETMVTGMKKHKQFTRSNIQRVTQFFADPNRSFPETKHFTSGPVLKTEAESMIDDDEPIPDEDQDEIHVPEKDNFNL